MAAERQKAIDSFLSNDNKYGEIFTERPFGGAAVTRSEFSSQSSQTANLVKLKWQSNATELLLAERLMDSILSLYEYQDNNCREFSGVRLEYDHYRKHTFPWVAVIQTNRPEVFKDILADLKEWLAIGIRFEPAVSFEQYGQCAATGNTGITGGIFQELNNTAFALTCSHVVDEHCRSLSFGAFPDGADDLPDAALIHINSPCFNISHLQSRPIQVAGKSLVDYLMVMGGKVHKAFPNTNRLTGTIDGRGIAYVCNGRVIRFPTLDIRLSSYVLFGLRFPFLKRNFSKPGESGSWVVERDSNTRLGMISAGIPGTSLCKIQEAGPLQDYFSKAMNFNFQPQSF